MNRASGVMTRNRRSAETSAVIGTGGVTVTAMLDESIGARIVWPPWRATSVRVSGRLASISAGVVASGAPSGVVTHSCAASTGSVSSVLQRASLARRQ